MNTVRAIVSSPRSILLFAAHAVVLASLVGCQGADESTGTTEPTQTISPVVDAPETPAPAAPVAERKNPAGTGETVSATFAGAAGGSIELSDGMQVYIPAGAFASAAETLSLTSDAVPASNTITTVTPTYTFQTKDSTFSKAIRLYIPVTVPADANVADLAILWSGAGTGGFEAVATTFLPVDGDPRSFLAVADVDRSGMGAAGFKSAPFASR